MEQPLGDRADDDRVRRGQGLQPRGHDRRLTDDGLAVPRGPGANFAGDDQAGLHADPHAQTQMVLGLETIIGVTKIRNDGEPRQDGAHGVVFMRLRIAEIDQQSVTAVLRDMTFVSLDRAHAGLVEHVQDLPHLLGIEPLRQRRGIDQVDEHHRELTPLAFDDGGRGRGGRSRPLRFAFQHGGRSLCHRRKRLRQPFAVAERQTQLP